MRHILAILNCAAVRYAIAIFWSVLLTLFLLQPEADPVIDLGLPGGDNTLAREVFFSTLHLIAFGITCFCWFWALQRNLKVKTSLAIACLIAIVLGGATEMLQSFTPDRHSSWLDLVANIFGALIVARLIWRHNLPRQATFP